ncbi:MAG: divergent PAP2 family protein [Spirochaetes bacterium]|nr:divergent PAP2 family protein [Spirochaetota bacterium]
MPATFPLSLSLVTALIAQVACQAFKVLLYSIREKRLNLRYFLSAGGMPSAHSAFVTALSVSIGLWNGFDSELFAVASVFSAIVMYDAYRLRGTVERHARALKALLSRHPEVSAGGLTDMVGHTPIEIAVGIAAGGGFAALVYLLVRQL